MGNLLFIHESLESVMSEDGHPTNGYFVLIKDVEDTIGQKYDVEVGHYVAGQAKTWGSGQNDGDSLAGKIASTKPHLKVVPFIAVAESRHEKVNHPEIHEMYKASLGNIDTFLIIEQTGAAIQYVHKEDGGIPYSEPQEVLTIPAKSIRTQFAKQYIKITVAIAEISEVLDLANLSSPHKTDKLD